MPLFTKTRFKPKRETMLSRSERIIGKSLQDESQDDEQSAEKSPNQDGSSKRRGQVLKAQRAHRRRTQNYISELEKEVLRLRKREAEMAAELGLRHSYSKPQSGTHADYLSGTISENGTPLGQAASDASTVTVDLSDYATMSPGLPCPTNALVPEPAFSSPSGDDLAKLTDSAIGNLEDHANGVFLADVQSAVDFILDFERPCLSHIKYDLNTKTPTPFREPILNYGRSHSCTVSARIIQSCPGTEWANQKIDLPKQAIESLLANSKSLPLGPEMTPVQVWDMLTDIGRDQSMSAANVAFFQRELHKYMRCNSFGATVPIDTLRQLVNFFFPWYNATYLHDTPIPASEPEVAILNDKVGSDWAQYF